MEPADQVLHLTKSVCAARQTDAAIEALLLGRYDVAITLAGAAEGMLPPLEGGVSLFSEMLSHPKAREQFSQKEWNSVLNRERDWLKHLTPNDASEIDLTLDDAAYMVARAMSKIALWSQQMEDFRLWYTRRVIARASDQSPP